MAIPQRKVTKEGIEMQWGINHLGHFYLTQLLWPKVKKSEQFRVVNVSSLAHKKIYGFFGDPGLDWENINFEKNYDQGISYGRSKLYNVLFTRALAEKIDPKQGKVTSLHPGVVRTELMREIRTSTAGQILYFISNVLGFPVYWMISKSAWEGAQTTLHAALSPRVENGCYYADCKKDS